MLRTGLNAARFVQGEVFCFGRPRNRHDPTRFEKADMVSVKIANATIMPTDDDSGSRLSAISDTHVTVNEPIRSTRRGSLIVSQMPISLRNPRLRSAPCRVAVEVAADLRLVHVKRQRFGRHTWTRDHDKGRVTCRRRRKRGGERLSRRPVARADQHVDVGKIDAGAFEAFAVNVVCPSIRP